jgi:hypothetical protein
LKMECYAIEEECVAFFRHETRDSRHEKARVFLMGKVTYNTENTESH